MISNVGQYRPYADNYMVGTDGGMYSLRKNRFIGTICKSGYVQVPVNGVKSYLHRVLGEVFLGLTSLHMNHKNFNRSDNKLSNLEVVTVSENNRHAHAKPSRKRDAFPKGTKHPQHKLSENDVLYIFNSNDSNRSLGRQFNVSHRTIFNIKHGIVWEWLTHD